jgi:ADP-ribose pyrophosphatase
MSAKHLANTTKVFEGARFDVHAVELARRGGGSMRREVVRPNNAVVILPLLDADTVLLIRNERFAVGETLWELPAGTLEEGEESQVCAERELIEETGYGAGRMTPLVEFYASPGFCTELLSAFLAENLTYRGQNLDETEKITIEPTPLSQTIQMIRDNRIRDGKTIATVLYYVSFRRG